MFCPDVVQFAVIELVAERLCMLCEYTCKKQLANSFTPRPLHTHFSLKAQLLCLQPLQTHVLVTTLTPTRPTTARPTSRCCVTRSVCTSSTATTTSSTTTITTTLAMTSTATTIGTICYFPGRSHRHADVTPTVQGMLSPPPWRVGQGGVVVGG